MCLNISSFLSLNCINMADAKVDPKKIRVSIAEDVQGGIYSNAVSVNVSPNEIVLDFGYLMPGGQEKVVKIMQRVNMTHRTAESFLKVFQNAVLDFRNKQKEAGKA
ncbi:MAG TPA: hypothetical protein DEG92_06730 [Rikenellaceae bacterium]|nr:hypothetical protein [Rikenellaceae bacterium]